LVAAKKEIFKMLFVYLMSENADWIGIHTLNITMRRSLLMPAPK
jgi:hypothetical protein